MVRKMDKTTQEEKSAYASVARRGLASNRGIALFMALIITLIVFLLVGSTLYFVTQGTRISGPRKAYKTASEAADGATQVTIDAIEKTIENLPLPGPNVFTAQFATDLAATVLTNNNTCTTTMILPGTMGEYTANVTVSRLYVKSIVGSRGPEFPVRFGSSGTAIFFRIVTIVTAVNGVSCEEVALYRHVI
jgi:Tfp pilus assembly protein PilX